MKKDGFTLLEILAVLAIVGTLLGIFGPVLVRSIQRAQFIEAQTAAAVLLQRGRSIAQRGSSDQAVTWTARSLTVGTQSLELPNGATIITPPLAATEEPLKYTAPHGELTRDARGQILTLQSAGGRWTADVVMMGVTGKVVRRSVRDAN